MTSSAVVPILGSLWDLLASQTVGSSSETPVERCVFLPIPEVLGKVAWSLSQLHIPSVPPTITGEHTTPADIWQRKQTVSPRWSSLHLYIYGDRSGNPEPAASIRVSGSSGDHCSDLSCVSWAVMSGGCTRSEVRGATITPSVSSRPEDGGLVLFPNARTEGCLLPADLGITKPRPPHDHLGLDSYF